MLSGSILASPSLQVTNLHYLSSQEIRWNSCDSHTAAFISNITFWNTWKSWETAISVLPELHFNIYPNPGKSLLQLETDIHLPFQLIIRNYQGSSVIEKEINTPHFILQDEVNKLSPGIYQVEVRMKKPGNDWLRNGSGWIRSSIFEDRFNLLLWQDIQ